MIYALNLNSEKIKPCKKIDAICPCCKSPVIAKIGKYKIAHWAHKIKPDSCDSKAMTRWHLDWQLFYEKQDGWVIEYIFNNMRLDAYNKKKNLVLEFQNNINFEYIINKTNAVLDAGKKINWIMSDVYLPESFPLINSIRADYKLFKPPKLLIFDIYEKYADVENVKFYIDVLDNHSSYYDQESYSSVLYEVKSANYKDNLRLGTCGLLQWERITGRKVIHDIRG